MRKSILAVSACAVLASSSYAGGDLTLELQDQLKALKAQVEMLEKKLNAQAAQKQETPKVDEARIEKIEKKLAIVDKTAKVAKIQSSGDKLKWDVDFRTQVDNIQYKLANGDKVKNNALLTNRLWLGAAYQADDNTLFRAKLSYNKAFGDTANHSQSNTQPGFANFDWVTNENATDNTVKVKEAYWLYKNDTLAGADVPWTVSVGRRPSTDGMPINLRNNQTANSPLSHVVDVEFDGFSAKFDTEKLIGLKGSWFKICGGRGLTNAKPRFSQDGLDYSNDNSLNANVDMLGFIAAPYDDGQYSVHINYARAWNLIGYTETNMTSFSDVGDIDYATILLKSYGIGDGINDYLDDTTVFASYAVSKTSPSTNLVMLGEPDSKTGNSIWLGINAPCPLSPDDSRIGVEWNKGSKYWRSMTYAEDSYAGSKIAARGTAWEIYRNQQITDALSWGMSYTKIKYDYTGSNAFFGIEGTPSAVTGTAVAEAQDIRAYMRYKF